ncbi:MAG: hypothetical protein C0397_17120 [Odoribacter sp.]|nr:hypothetical protein [Odoribacter sp.]
MLINTIAEIQQYVAVGKDTEFNRIKPHLVSAQSAYIRPILGAALLETLQSANFSELPYPDTLTEQEIAILKAQKELLKTVQKALVYLAYWSGFQVLNATISDSGFKRTESTTVKALYKYQEDDLRNHFKTNGFNALDEILETLETNIFKFEDFKNSPNWTVHKANFIPDTKSLDAIVFIGSSRLTYLRLIPKFKLIEDLYISPLLGAVLFDKIKAEMIKENPDQDILKIIPYIQKPIAYLATAMLMEESGADLTEKGLYFESTTAISHTDRNTSPSDADRINVLTKRNRSFADNYLEMLKSFLIASSSTFPEFAGKSGNFLRRDNNDKKTFWT